uniref:F-box only protein 34 n=1 Tax=Semicossyphus pulcher TaxID=241346 RepID=UPI0037E93CAC
MHLKSCQQLVRSELCCDVSSVQQGALLRTCSSNHGNSGRLPLSVLSTNTLRRSNTTDISVSSSVASLWLKASPSTALQLLPRPTGCENEALRLHQITSEDTDAPLDIWNVIKPGHVREKIAIFASDGGRTDGSRGSECTSNSVSRDRTPSACQSHAPMTALIRAVKAKGSWEEKCNAKRRRRSGNNQNLQQDQRTQAAQQLALTASPQRLDSDQSVGMRRAGEQVTEEEGEEMKVSVGEMVAFLEQRASEQQPDSKPVLTLQRSSASITLSRAPPPELREGSEVRGEEPESIKVSDMVARLESECLRRRTEGDLSRSNSLRRTVGRVLLATGDQSPAHFLPASLSSVTSLSSTLSGVQPVGREPISCSETQPVSTLTPPSSPGLAMPPSGVAEGLQRVAPPLTQNTPPQCVEAEPLPGLLFLSPAATEILCPSDSAPPPINLEPHPPRYRMTCDLEPCPPIALPDSNSQSERRRRQAEQEQAVGLSLCSTVLPVGRRASQDFLLMRQRLQQLLEPQPYLSVLPHHLLVKIFLLLPTHSLAALKCTCHYFLFLIDSYGVRPADSLWVSDPRYCDDPCKQCKKRYVRGDVSLCRWHHKPFCRALPHGPGFWMCCHGARRDAPGCNVGLHDNRWVPAFHSINVPIYRRSRHDD